MEMEEVQRRLDGRRRLEVVIDKVIGGGPEMWEG